jgi:hypothetical protein
MGRIVFTLVTFMFAMTLGATLASADAGAGDGHSFAWFRDADGDGIPNGMDDDWVRPEDGTGYQLKNRFGLFGMGAFWGNGDDTNAYINQNRHRKNKPDAPGDCFGIRLQLRDGSCK